MGSDRAILASRSSARSAAAGRIAADTQPTFPRDRAQPRLMRGVEPGMGSAARRSGPGMARGAAAMAAVLSPWLFAQTAAQGLPTPEPTTLGNCPLDVTQCCRDLVNQANEACLEYETMGQNDATCLTWRQLTYSSCVQNCANCSAIAYDVGRQCRFALGPALRNGVLIERYCSETMERFEKYRCTSVCEPMYDPNYQDKCLNEENATDCMDRCGNVQNCDCREQPTSVAGTRCVGDPYDKGPIPWRKGSGLNFSCDNVEPECMHHIPRGHNYSTDPPGCAKWRKCVPDFCRILRTKCVRPHQCMDEGTCMKETGKCEYYPMPKGTNCSDGISFTVNDSCDNGECIGVTDYCKKYNVRCKPLNPTCVTGGTCHPHTGRCTYDNLPDGTPCDDNRSYTVEDRCEKGLCVGMYVNLCTDFGTVCTSPSECFDPGICDPKTGECSEATAKLENVPCDDNDYMTVNDTCIDGICLGILQYVGGFKFLTMGKGDCTDRDGRRMATYSGDVADEPVCQDICAADPQCAAYAYAYPLCTIYGTVRTRAPKVNGTTWAFTFASDPPGVVIEKATMLFRGQKEMYCRKKGTVGDVVDPSTQTSWNVDDLYNYTYLGGFFIGLALIFFCPCCIWSCYRCCFKNLENEGDPLEDGTKVYRNPLEALADGGPEAFMRRVKVVPYGVLGYQITKKGKKMRPSGAEDPGFETVVVDPVTLAAVQSDGPNPTGAAAAGGAASFETEDLRTWLGIAKDVAFKKQVREAITDELTAKLVSRIVYNGKRCIHVAAPDLRAKSFSILGRDRRVHFLAAAYADILAEFASATDVQGLRLAPILFGANACDEYVQQLTADAVAASFGLLPAELQLRLLDVETSIEFCVLGELDFQGYSDAFERRIAGQVAPETAPPGELRALAALAADMPALEADTAEPTAALEAPAEAKAIADVPGVVESTQDAIGDAEQPLETATADEPQG